MRRILAIFVLAATAFGSVAPVALVAADANTPACCRRDGKHHCAAMTDMAGMAGMSATGDGASLLVRAAGNACPYRTPSSTPARTTYATARDSGWFQSSSAILVSRTDRVGFTAETVLPNSERGPPASL